MHGRQIEGALAIAAEDDQRTTRRKRVRAQDLAQCPRASGERVAEEGNAVTASWASELAQAERVRDTTPAPPWGDEPGRR